MYRIPIYRVQLVRDGSQKAIDRSEIRTRRLQRRSGPAGSSELVYLRVQTIRLETAAPEDGTTPPIAGPRSDSRCRSSSCTPPSPLEVQRITTAA